MVESPVEAEDIEVEGMDTSLLLLYSVFDVVFLLGIGAALASEALIVVLNVWEETLPLAMLVWMRCRTSVEDEVLCGVSRECQESESFKQQQS